jgi:bifunctional DNA-binding transcriptional regulator/antitoxin component of YhaV-PrlF toxin-antitoxin module
MGGLRNAWTEVVKSGRMVEELNAKRKRNDRSEMVDRADRPVVAWPGNYRPRPMSDFSSFPVRLDDDGRIALPARACRELNLRPGDTLVAESDGHSLLLRRDDQLLREARGFVRPFLPRVTGAVEERVAARPARNRRP